MKELFINNKSDGVSFTIFGDTVQTKSNKALFEKGDLPALVGDGIIEVLKESDASVFNLEAPLFNGNCSIFKPGAPCISSTEESVSFFKSAKELTDTVILSCANNHIKDFGLEGIRSTERLANENRLEIIGVSSVSKDFSAEPIVLTNGKVRVGIYSCAENEFSIANENEGGANGYDPLETFDHLTALKDNSDYVVVLFHAGRENYRFPSLNLQRICRKMIDKGADLIVCQHSHCIGCQEQYNEKVIIYGQGNFIFDRLNTAEWHTGLIIKCIFLKENMDVTLLPSMKEGSVVRLATDDLRETILREFYERSRLVYDTSKLEYLWEQFCLKNLNLYSIEGIYGCQNRFIKWLDRKTKFAISKHLLSNKYHNKLLLNYIRCESIRESMMTLLNMNINTIKYNEL